MESISTRADNQLIDDVDHNQMRRNKKRLNEKSFSIGKQLSTEVTSDDSADGVTDDIQNLTKVVDLNTAVQKFAKPYCSRCEKTTAVIVRKARCKSCRTLYRYDCACHRSYKTYTDLCYHLRLKHMTPAFSRKIHQPGKTHRCNKCAKTFTTSNHMHVHRDVCNVTDPTLFSCDKCSYKTKYKSTLNSHVKSRHTVTDVKCLKCGKSYTNERALKRHTKVYCGKRRSLQCNHCHYSAYRKDQLTEHLKLKHPKLFPRDSFRCKRCDKVFKQYYQLSVHFKRCTDK